MGSRRQRYCPARVVRLVDNRRTPIEQGKTLDLAAYLAICVHTNAFCEARCARRSLQGNRAAGFFIFRGPATQLASAVLVFPRATPFRRKFKRDQRARANFHLARAFTLLFQLVEESLADAVGLAKLRNTERQARRWRSRPDGSELGCGISTCSAPRVEGRRHLANALIGTIFGVFDAPTQFWPTLPPRASAFSCVSCQQAG